jgi:serine protease AprX
MRRTDKWHGLDRLLHAAMGALLAMSALAAAGPHPSVAVIVRANTDVRDALAAVADAGGTAERTLGIINAVQARVPAGTIAQLQSSTGVAAVTPDARLHLQSVDEIFDRRRDNGSLQKTAKTVDADELWNNGITGAGVDIAVIDSGIARVPGLDAEGAVVDGPDLSFEGGDAARHNKDGYGHGTHLAGIIAGRSADATGVAPGARLVSVKVADSNGSTDVSQVIAAIDWVVQRGQRDGLHIRVLNLAFGTDGGGDYRTDPLACAVEVAWKRGVVVVVSAGNGGTTLGRLSDPAIDPYVIAVGAAETNGTRSLADDRVADFSSRGDGSRNPDVVAPGRSIVSLRSPGSYVDTEHPEARVGPDLVRGSGTSQAAAVVTGAAALVLQKKDNWSPDQVKAALMSGARPIAFEPPPAQGAGLVNVLNAVSASPGSAEQTWEPATGRGSIEGARGSMHTTIRGDTVRGDRDAWGRQFDSTGWAAASWSGSSWSGSSWSGSSWSGSSWSGSSWSGSSWTGSSWTGSSWTSTEWG